MELRPLGDTGLRVSSLGFGAMQLGDPRCSEAEAATLLNAVLDLGVNLIDTARSYGLSEERIGRHLAHRRDQFLLSTKVGYGIEGVPDWSYDCVVQGVERALRLMRCEVIDIVHLHSCPLPVLQQGDATRALLDCQRAGKLRVAAYSGDNAELRFALRSGTFGALQSSVSVCDQDGLDEVLHTARQQGLGVLAKRPLAGAIWRLSARPGDGAESAYWERWQALGMDALCADAGLAPDELALRFALHQPGVSCALVGTLRLDSLRRNLAALAKGPLPSPLQAQLRQRFSRLSQGSWPAWV